MMRSRMIWLTAVAMLSTGCATVNMTDMAVPVSAKAQTPAEKNIVLRAANKLYTAFQTKGFVTKTSRHKMQSAASILLNGLEPAMTVNPMSLAAQIRSRALIKSFIGVDNELCIGPGLCNRSYLGHAVDADFDL